MLGALRRVLRLVFRLVVMPVSSFLAGLKLHGLHCAAASAVDARPRASIDGRERGGSMTARAGAISTRLALKQPARAELSRERHPMGLAWIATAMPVVNAIPAVCRAAPGVCSYLDLPLICASDLVQSA